MHPHTKDLTGQRFGRLVALGIAKRNPVRWLCRCDCDAEKVVRSCHLVQGKIESCGCLQRERAKLSFPRHGMTDTPSWRSWKGIFDRCCNPKSRGYKSYGGRGVTVCDRWRVYENFYEDMGERPAGATLDRIDVNGNYEPGNCRWATMKEQQRNKRNSCVHHYRGRDRTIAEIAEMLGVNWSTVKRRISRGALV